MHDRLLEESFFFFLSFLLLTNLISACNWLFFIACGLELHFHCHCMGSDATVAGLGERSATFLSLLVTC